MQPVIHRLPAVFIEARLGMKFDPEQFRQMLGSVEAGPEFFNNFAMADIVGSGYTARANNLILLEPELISLPGATWVICPSLIEWIRKGGE